MVFVPGSGELPSDEFGNVTLEAWDIGVDCQAIGVKFTGLPQLASVGTDAWALIKELVVETRPRQEITVEVDDTGTGDATTLYAPTAKARLIDANSGLSRNHREEAGEVTEEEARRYAHYVMRYGLRRMTQRTYITDAPPTTLPTFGQTLRMPDGFEGVLMQHPGLRLSRGKEMLTMILVNFDGGWD